MRKNDYVIGDHTKNTSPNSGGSHFGPRGSQNSMHTSEKAKDFKKSIKRLTSYSKNHLPIIAIAMLLSTVACIISLIGPNKLSDITNLILQGMMTGIDIKKVFESCVFLTVIYSLSFIFNYMQGFITSTVSQNISKKLRNDISNKINRLPLKYFDLTSYGDILSRVTNDVDIIGQTLNQSLPTLLNSIIMFFGSIFMMFHTNWIMALSGIFSTAIGFCIMIFTISKSQKYFLQQQQELGHINGHIEEIYAGQNIVKIYNGEKQSKKTFNEINERLYKSAWKSQFISGIMMPIMGFVGNLGYVVVCIVGALLAMNGSISFGIIVAFMVYIRLFSHPLSQLAQVATTLQSTAAASERVFELLNENELTNESEKIQILKNVKGDICFSDISFGYTSEKMIIHNFSANIKAGQKVAIVGPTGAGKTTIVNLLMRFYDINSGHITIDGVDINTITRESIHDLFCMVLQDTWLFEGTIKENIVYCKENITDEQIIKVCKSVGLHHFIKTLPKGYDTILNDKANLSTGQKQLITIARAMIENAPLLILDEATSSVDTRTEMLIQQSMDKLTEGKTSFIIAHRLSTIKNADLILVMKDGNIIESGNHNELISQKGFYEELYNSQFEQAS